MEWNGMKWNGMEIENKQHESFLLLLHDNFDFWMILFLRSLFLRFYLMSAMPAKRLLLTRVPLRLFTTVVQLNTPVTS